MQNYILVTITTALITTVSVSTAAAHIIPWRAGESRMLGWGHCAKGPCMNRYSWAESKPHRHVGDRIVFDKILSPR